MKHFLETIGYDKIPEDTVIIGNDLALSKFGDNLHTFGEPTKLTHAIIVICTAGHFRARINLKEYDIESPMVVTLMPGQIVEAMNQSINFQGYTIALSRRFIDLINLPGWQAHYMKLYNNPVNEVSSDTMQMMLTFYTILYRAASNEENPFRLQVIENLIRVFFYGGISSFKREPTSTPSYKNSIVERFISLVEENYRTERLIGFYADKLCITPKYLSKLVKENTGRSAGDWIESHVILEARAMLQSSDLTIQQIATSLNFPNQSFFGKYFKRAMGVSPKQYRRGNQK